MYSSEQVCQKLKIGRNSLDKIRRQLRNRKKLVDYQPVDDSTFALIADIVDVQREKRCPWPIATDIILDMPTTSTVEDSQEQVVSLMEASCLNMPATDAATTHRLLEFLVNGDGSSDELASTILQEKYEKYDAFVGEVTKFSDFLRRSGSHNLSVALNSCIDTFAKAAAFDLLHNDGLLTNLEK